MHYLNSHSRLALLLSNMDITVVIYEGYRLELCLGKLVLGSNTSAIQTNAIRHKWSVSLYDKNVSLIKKLYVYLLLMLLLIWY